MVEIPGRKVEVAVDALDRSSGLAKGAEEGVVDAGGHELVARARSGQVLDAAGRGDAPAAQHGDAVARALDLREQVRVEQHGLSPLRLLLEEVADLAAAHGIDAVRRLVEQKDFGVVDHRRRQAQPLRHALRELLHADVGPFRQPHALEELRGPLADEGRVHARHAPENRERLARGQVARKSMPLRQVSDAPAALRVRGRKAQQARRARSGTRQAQQDLHGRRLAGAVWPKQTKDLALLDPQIDAAQGGDPARAEAREIDLRQADSLDGCCHRGS